MVNLVRLGEKMKENNLEAGDYSLPFLMMIAKNMREHHFSNLDIGYILVALFHASGQEAELVTDSNLINETRVDLNIGQDLFASVANHGSGQNPERREYVAKLLKLFNRAEHKYQ